MNIEHTIETDGTLAPKRETDRLLLGCKTLTIKAGGKSYSGAMTMTIDDEQNAVISCAAAKPAKRGKK